MIQIAICDDDMTTTSQIEEYIRQIETEQHIQVQSRIFFDGKSFMQSVESGEVYDLIYLDVEMPLMKGLDVAKKLREMEISSLIIYISNYETYCESMIETEPFRFLRKPINDVDLFRKYFMSAYKKLEEQSLMEKQMLIYSHQLDVLMQSEEKVKALRHDMKNHLQCISSLLDDKEYEKAESYVADIIKNKLDFEFKQINTGNRVVDAISNAKLTQCKNENILTTVNAGSIETSIDDVDMCSLLGNIFDNAIEACRKVEKNKKVHFEINQKKGYINIIMKNSIQNSVIENNPKLQTTKKHRDIHGYGIKSVKGIVEKYNGMMELFEQAGFFIADIWVSCEDFE